MRRKENRKNGCLGYDKAVSKAEAASLSALGYPRRVYPPDSLIATPGCDNQKCFGCHLSGCAIRGEECWCVYAPCGNPFPCTILEQTETLQEEVGSICQFVDVDLAKVRADGMPVPCCEECETPCKYECSRSVAKRKEAEAVQEQEAVEPTLPECATSHKNDADGVQDELDDESKDDPAQEAAEARDEREEDEDLLCDDCANASSLTGNPDLCPNCCGSGGGEYKPLSAERQEPESGTIVSETASEQAETESIQPICESDTPETVSDQSEIESRAEETSEPRFTSLFLRDILYDRECKLAQMEELNEEARVKNEPELPERMMQEHRAVVAGLRLLLEYTEMREEQENEDDE